MGCVYQARANKGNTETWFIKFRCPKPTGDGFFYKVESSRGTDKRAAKLLLAKRETEVAEGKPVAQTAGRKQAYTFEVARDTIVGEYRRRRGEATALHLKRQIDRQLLPVFGGRRMADITRDQITAYADARLKAGAANATVQKELRFLSRMFTLGIAASRLSWKPAMPQVGVDNARQGFFERADFDAVRSRMPEHYRDLLTLTYWTGWRMQSELAPLEWRNIDLAAREIRIYTSKNGEGRVFPYATLPDVCAAMDRLAARRETFRDKGTITAKVFVRDDGSAVVLNSERLVTPTMRPEFRHAWTRR